MPHAGDLWLAISRRDIQRVVELIDFDRGFATYRNPHANAATPLHLAAGNREPRIVHILLDTGVDVNAQDDRHGETPLHIAALSGDVEAVRLLLEHGADVTIRDRNGKTPLFASTDIGSRHQEAIQAMLLEAGAGAVMTVFDAARMGDLASVTEMIDADPGLIEAKDTGYRESTPLHHAAETDQIEIVRYLLSKGADARAEDCWEWTPLGLAKEFSQSPELIHLLEAHGAVEPTSPGCYPFSEEASRQWPSCWPEPPHPKG